MLNLFVNGEGGLTTAGYALSAALLVLSILAGLALADRGGKKGFAAKQLAYCAMAVALAYVTSFIRVFKLPYGGSVTLLSMLFIVLVANWYGVKTGMLVGFAYGILQFLQEPYFLSLFQVCCDYVLAFAALGLAGLFRGKKNSLLTGYIAAVLARGVFHSIGGYLYWMDYMPENFPLALRNLYPIIYNYSYLQLQLFTGGGGRHRPCHQDSGGGASLGAGAQGRAVRARALLFQAKHGPRKPADRPHHKRTPRFSKEKRGGVA